MFRLYDSVSEMLKSGSGVRQHMADLDFSSINVMVVDDDESSRKLVTRILEALGVGHVLAAENGVDALARLGDGDADVDVIICDVEMPEMAGYEFARRIRYGVVPRFKDVPIMMLTGQPTEKNVQRARTHKINGFMEKPPSADLMRIKIRDVLDQLLPHPAAWSATGVRPHSVATKFPAGHHRASSVERSPPCSTASRDFSTRQPS